MLVISLSFVILISSESLADEGKNLEINLIDEGRMWLPFSAANVYQNSTDLSIIVSTEYDRPLFNRAFLPIQINSTSNNTLFFNLDYGAITYAGNQVFFVEIRDNNTYGVLWSSILNDTNGQFANETFNLPTIILNKPLEFRFYIWTNGPGESALDVKKAVIRSSNETYFG